VVYLDFWASWCAPCAKSFPFLNALQRDLGPRGLQVVGVSVDEQPAEARAFLAEHRADFAVGVDSTGQCQRAWGVEGVPTGFLIDRQGRVRYLHRAYRASDAEGLRRQLERLLNEPAVLPAVSTPLVAPAQRRPPSQPSSPP
jgi:peroxiredoxin